MKATTDDARTNDHDLRLSYYLLVASWSTALIDNGGPGWLHLVVLICIWNALKIVALGPVSLAMLVKRHQRS